MPRYKIISLFIKTFTCAAYIPESLDHIALNFFNDKIFKHI